MIEELPINTTVRKENKKTGRYSPQEWRAMEAIAFENNLELGFEIEYAEDIQEVEGTKPQETWNGWLTREGRKSEKEEEVLAALTHEPQSAAEISQKIGVPYETARSVLRRAWMEGEISRREECRRGARVMHKWTLKKGKS